MKLVESFMTQELSEKLKDISIAFNVPEQEVLTWLRSSVRSSWGDSPMKRYMETKHKFQVENTNPRSCKRFPKVWRIRCALCEEAYSPLSMELDHVYGDNSLKTYTDAQSFIDSIIFVKEEDLQWLCIDQFRVKDKKKVLVKHGCHGIKTYSERHNISFKEAMITKYAINIVKTKKDKEFFHDRNLLVPSNLASRRSLMIEILLNELNNADTIKQ